MLHSRHSLGSILVSALLMSGLVACKKNKPPQTDPVGQTGQSELSVMSVSPGEGLNSEMTSITVKGNGFESGAKVFIGDSPAQNVTVDGSTSVTATVPDGLAANSYLVVVRNPDGSESSLARGFTVLDGSLQGDGNCELGLAYFEFNEATLTESSRSSLQSAIDCLESRNADRVRLEGHADNRGSTDYNLALGQRRAESVRNYLGNLGFSASSIQTLSYGEERPISYGENEGAWAQNRRVEIVIVE